MFVDASKATEPETLAADLCVIGAGAAGIAIALQFAHTPIRVVVLEGGGLTEEPSGRGLYGVVHGSPPRLAIDPRRTWYFGGAANHWSGNCRPLDEPDFEAREWVPYSGWPIRRAQLLPFYEQAQVVCGLGDFRYYDIAACRPHLVHPPIDVDPAKLTHKVVQACPELRFSQLYLERLGEANNVQVWLHARALRLETNAQGDRVRAVEVGAGGGRRFRVAPGVVVLAAGGIENPRLLLCSNDVIPAGLGNGNDLVGRFFMEHPWVDLPLSRRKGRPDLHFYHGRQRVGGATVWGQLVLSEAVMRQGGLSAISAWLNRPPLLEPAWAAKAMDLLRGQKPEVHRAGTARRPGTRQAAVKRIWSKLGRRARRLLPGGGYFLRVSLEQMPDPRNHVRLSSERDDFGQPLVRFVYQATDTARQRHGRALAILANELGLDGERLTRELHSAFRDERVGYFWHHMGTTRMHADPQSGVVDGDCRVHGVSNLFVAGSSVFPTGGTAAPTLTIVALALRLADHIRRRFP